MSFSEQIFKNKIDHNDKFDKIYDACRIRLSYMKEQAVSGKPEYEEYVSVNELSRDDQNLLYGHIIKYESADVREHISLINRTITKDTSIPSIRDITGVETIILFKY